MHSLVKILYGYTEEYMKNYLYTINQFPPYIINHIDKQKPPLRKKSRNKKVIDVKTKENAKSENKKNDKPNYVENQNNSSNNEDKYIEPAKKIVFPQSFVPQSKIQNLPSVLDIEGPTSNEAYNSALNDRQLTLSPKTLGFLPSDYWMDIDRTFGDIVTNFFRKKNHAKVRFPSKLYNALSIVEHDPTMYNLVGVKWITDKVFKVDKFIFGRLLGMASIDGGLFHRTGSFPSHLFDEVTGPELEQLKASYDLSDVDHDRVHLLHHQGNCFSKESDDETIANCRRGKLNVKIYR